MSVAGILGEQVPDHEILLRLTFRSSDGKISPEAFELSSADKLRQPARLSVFGASRTTSAQAWLLANRNPRFAAVARLATVAVRQIASLDVRWDPLKDDLPGASGHAAILGLDQPAVPYTQARG